MNFEFLRIHFLFNCVSMCGYLHKSECQKTLRLALLTVVNCPTLVLGAELRSFAKAVLVTLKRSALSPSLDGFISSLEMLRASDTINAEQELMLI